ncbi:MAG: hypothetical protein KGR98_03485, partial [Verrucomicrobia bacterium]|nr:hypothetical protein [Verrucomicrobiota bacterium]
LKARRPPAAERIMPTSPSMHRFSINALLFRCFHGYPLETSRNLKIHNPQTKHANAQSTAKPIKVIATINVGLETLKAYSSVKAVNKGGNKSNMVVFSLMPFVSLTNNERHILQSIIIHGKNVGWT